MIRQSFPSISARLWFFSAVILTAYFVVVITGIAVFDQLDQANRKQFLLLGQERSLHDYQRSVFESMVLIDRIVLEDQRSLIHELLALSEDSPGYFGRYLSTAQSAGLEHDRYAADEYEALVFHIRSDFFEIVSLHRDKKYNRLEKRDWY